MPTLETIRVDELEPATASVCSKQNDTPPRPTTGTNAAAGNDTNQSAVGGSKAPVETVGRRVTPGHSLRKSPTRAKKQQSESQISIASFFSKTAPPSPKAPVASKRVDMVQEPVVEITKSDAPTPAPLSSSALKKKKAAATRKSVAKKARTSPPSASRTAPLAKDEQAKRQMLEDIVMMGFTGPSTTAKNDATETATDAYKVATAALKSDPDEAVVLEDSGRGKADNAVVTEEVDRLEKQAPTKAGGEAVKENDVMHLSEEDPNVTPTEHPLIESPAQQQDDVVVVKEAPQSPPSGKLLYSTTSGGDPSKDKELTENEPVEPVISDARQAIVDNYTSLRFKYTRRASELMERGRDGLAEEAFDILDPAHVAASVEDVEGTGEEFPDAAVRCLLTIVQESRLPLSELTAKAMSQLGELYPGLTFTAESVLSKIKIVATRESYINHPEVSSGQRQTNAAVNVFEDTSKERAWRWEVSSLELLPESSLSSVKKARAARRKLRTQFKALCKLLFSLHDADTLLRDPSTAQTKLDVISAKISSEEEKVLKYEREEEKARLIDEVKRRKELAKKTKELEKQLQQKEKENALEKKRKLQEKKRQDAQEKKLEVKRRKEEEVQKREAMIMKKQQRKDQHLNKQRSTMMKFFATEKSHSPHRKTTESESSEEPSRTIAGVDTEKFWGKVNSGFHGISAPIFSQLSDRAAASRKKRTRPVPVSVYVTVASDENAFNAPAYAEQQTVHVSNKYRFLSFFEDCRPAYHGTWSKNSTVITGTNPFGQDTTFLDYEVDSEAEWEEGDDELGEDLENDVEEDEDADEEARDTRMYDFQDGWMAADDDLGDEDEEVDEQTMELRKKKLLNADTDGQKQATFEQIAVSVVGPLPGGIPFSVQAADKVKTNCTEGLVSSQAVDMLSVHRGQVLDCDDLWLDAFPPPLVEENVSAPKAESTPHTQEMSRDDLKVFVKFVHHCTFPSKDRVVEELRTAHKTTTSSRAQATRKLDSMAIKRRNPVGGAIWEVKRTVLEDLEMEELLKMKLPEEPNKLVARKKSQLGTKPAGAKKSPAEAKPANSKKRPADSKPAAAKKKETTKSSLGSKPQAKKRATLHSEPTAKKTDPAGSTLKQTADPKESSRSEKSTPTDGDKKRKTPEVSQASVKLFAGFIQKRSKTEGQ